MRLRLRRRKELDETIELEIVRSEEIDPFAVTELELDLVGIGPLDLVQAGLRPHELLAHTLEGHAENRDRRVGEEDQTPAGPKQTRRLRNPAVRVGPEGRSVLRESEIEGRVRQWHVLTDRLDQRELDPGLVLQPARGRELRRRRVDADDARAAASQPG